MAYFLKKVNQKGRTYLSICESFYDPVKKGTAHKSYKSLGSVESNIEKGIKDPIAYFQKEVDNLNKEKKENSQLKISDTSPIVNLGYFPIKSILESLDIKKHIDFFQLAHGLDFNLYDVLSLIVFVKALNPCNKYITCYEKISDLNESYDFTYNQLLTGLEFLGEVYEKIVEIFTRQTVKVFKIDTKKSYFVFSDEPIMTIGLFVNNNQIPLSMKVFNDYDNVINEIKENTLQVGLSSGPSNDGYIISKSLTTLSKKEIAWLLEEDYKEAKNANGDLLYLYKSQVILNEKNLLVYDPGLADYVFIVTSETKMPDKEIYNAYSNLLKIKSDLDEESPFFQHENIMKGCFLISYIGILLEKLLEIKVLEGEFSSLEISNFMKDFNVTRTRREYINMAKSTNLIDTLAKKFNLPLTDYYLTESNIKKILSCQLPKTQQPY